jgi:hypothetical protein
MNFKTIKTPVMLVALGSLMAACASSSSVLDSYGISDRFSQIFGSKSQAAGESANAGNSPDETDLYCPDVIIREGTATLSSTVNGVSGVAAMRYQGTITRTARECVLQGGTMMAIKIGIQGRVIAGPAGSPPEVEVPLRIAVVQDGAEPKTIFSRFYKIPVAMTEGGNTIFSYVAEDISYPAPSASAHASYVYYVGFDPAGLRQQPPRAAKKKGR